MRKSGLVASAAAGCALVALGVPVVLSAGAIAAPTAAPPSDGQGYVNSTARCTAPDTAVIFGTTETSRVAVCKTAGGDFQYRGVRVSDGAKLIAAATQTAGNTFVITYDGATYTVTPQALSVTINGNTFRTETWADYHGPQAPASSSTSASSKPSTSTSATTSGTATPTTTASATSTTTAPKTSAPKTSAAPSTSAAPLPPPLPAEVGAGTSATG